MALEFDDATAPFESEWAWRGGALAGLVATVVMGFAITVTNQPVLQESIAGLYGQEGSLIAGWVAHLVHGTLFGALFALVLADPGLYRLTDWRWKTLLAGVVYALMLAVFGAGVIMPMWLEILGFASPPTFPFVTTTILLWHLLYGIVLGAVFPFVEHV
jgi:protein-S-isoprenylcysteine O-methyltransferase Ste14